MTLHGFDIFKDFAANVARVRHVSFPGALVGRPLVDQEVVLLREGPLADVALVALHRRPRLPPRHRPRLSVQRVHRKHLKKESAVELTTRIVNS